MKLPAYNLFLIVGACITCTVILSSPSDPKNAIIFGYSLERILLASSLIVFAFPLLLWTLKLVRQPKYSQSLWSSFLQNNLIYFLTIVCLFSLITLVLLPSYRLGDFAPYVSRLYPILIWVTVVSIVTASLFIKVRRTESLWFLIFENKTFLITTLFALLAFVVILLLVILTGIGIRHPEDYWFGAGVPVLGLQVTFSLIVGILFAVGELKRSIKNELRSDLVLCFIIFFVTAFLWAREPVLPNFFMPDTGKNVMYPYSDSATFDIGGQFALIGEKFFSGAFFDRILYSSLLTYLHIFAGQNFDRLLTFQAILFSIFPVIIYLIGKELHSRAFGLAISTLISLRGINAILAATWINLAGPKLMTTDFPTAIGIALFLLFAIKWIKDSSKLHFALLAGGALGLTMMLRTHVLFVAFGFIFYLLIVKWNSDWKYRWLGVLALIVGMLTATTPWDLRNLNNGTPMFYLYYSRIQTILEARYGIESDAYIPIEGTYAIATNRDLPRQRIERIDESGCVGIPCKITNHFFHNLITSFLFLPSSFMFEGLWNTVKEGAPYWQIAWKGSGINFVQWLLIFFNMIFVSLGIGTAWSKQKWLGIFPLFIFFVYMGTNALALTSAGRYIAPADWIICIYYVLGIFQLILWVTHWAGIMPKMQDQVEVKHEAQDISSVSYRQIFPTLVLIFAFGSLIPLAELPFEKRYQVREPQAILSELQMKGLIEKSVFSESEYLEFLTQPNARIVEGRILYPRYYKTGDGEPDRSTYYRQYDFPHLVFTVIGPYAAQGQGVVIAGDRINFSIHAEDVIVIGCWNTTYYAPFIDAVVVFVLNDEGYVYNRNPRPELSCPLQEP